MIDLYNDPGHGTLRHLLRRAPGAVEMLKTAELEDYNTDLPATAFAWEAKRLYPIHTAEHAAVSYLYAKHAAHNPPREVVSAICDALDIYGIDESRLAVHEVKEASYDPEDCLFPEQQIYPVRDAGEVKTAERRLHEQLPSLHPETRADVFVRLAKAAQLHGVKLSTASMKLAGLTYTDREALVDSLNARGAATKDSVIRAKFAALANSVSRDRAGLRDPVVRAKLAAAIGTLDEQAGLTGHYDRLLSDPIATVYNSTKVAASDDIDLGGGRMVSPAAVAALPTTFFSDVFGNDIVAEIAPNGHVQPELVQQVMATFPADMKQQLARALSAAGVSVAQV